MKTSVSWCTKEGLGTSPRWRSRNHNRTASTDAVRPAISQESHCCRPQRTSSSSSRDSETRLSIAQLCGLKPKRLQYRISVRRTHFGLKSLLTGGAKHRGMTPTASQRQPAAGRDGTFRAPSDSLVTSEDACGPYRRDSWETWEWKRFYSQQTAQEWRHPQARIHTRCCTECHLDLERIPFWYQSFHQIHDDPFATVNRPAPTQRAEKMVSLKWCCSPSASVSKIVHQYSLGLLPNSSSFSRAWPSSSVTAWRQSTCFLASQARRPSLHFARALSFSVSVQGRLRTAALIQQFLLSWSSQQSGLISENQCTR